MDFVFEEATKDKARLRLALLGPAGSGKTYSALAIATALGQRVAVIDSEHGAASKYGSGKPFRFQRLNLTTFAPATYVEAIHAAEDAGFDVIVIDSLSHAWMGKDGALEMVDRAAKKGGGGGNSFGAWRDVTPQHNALVEAMLACRAHLIVTMRVKTDYVQEKDDRTGRSVVRKVGLAPVQRDGLEYEFDVVMDVNSDHEGIVSKTRCPELTDKVFARPGVEVAKILAAWLSDAQATPVETFRADLARVTSEREAVACWVAHKAALGSGPDGRAAWRELCERVRLTSEQLRDAVQQGTQQPDNDPTPSGPSGSKRTQGTTSTEAHGAAREGQQSGATQASVTTLPHVPVWAATPDGIRAHLSTKGTRSEIENSVRVHGKALGAAYQTPAAERLVAVSTPSDDGARLGMIGATILVEGWAFQGPRPKAEPRKSGVGR